MENGKPNGKQQPHPSEQEFEESPETIVNVHVSLGYQPDNLPDPVHCDVKVQGGSHAVTIFLIPYLQDEKFTVQVSILDQIKPRICPTVSDQAQLLFLENLSEIQKTGEAEIVDIGRDN